MNLSSCGILGRSSVLWISSCFARQRAGRANTTQNENTINRHTFSAQTHPTTMLSSFPRPSLSDTPSIALEMIDVEKGSRSNNTTDESSSAPCTTPPFSTQGLLKPIPETTCSERIAAMAGAVTFVTSLLAILVLQSFPVVIAGILSTATGVVFYYQETRLTDIRTLQQTKNALTSHVNQLVQSNQELLLSKEQVQGSVDRLQELERATAVLNTTESVNVETFAGQIQVNKGILKSLKSNAQAVVLQNLLSVILRSDVNQDMVISSEELEDMIERMQSIAGLSVNEDKLRETCRDQSIETIMDLVRHVLVEDENESALKGAVFSIQEQS